MDSLSSTVTIPSIGIAFEFEKKGSRFANLIFTGSDFKNRLPVQSIDIILFYHMFVSYVYGNMFFDEGGESYIYDAACTIRFLPLSENKIELTINEGECILYKTSIDDLKTTCVEFGILMKSWIEYQDNLQFRDSVENINLYFNTYL